MHLHKTLLLHLKLFVTVYLLTLLASAPAQGKILFYSTFAKNGVNPAECLQESAIVKPLIERYGSPVDWTWVVACDDPAWERIQARTSLAGVNGVVGMTDLANHRTFIRGYVIIHPFNNTSDGHPGHIIAHELGHILLRTANEDQAERKAGELLRTPASLTVMMVGGAK
jgi:hypothetical protein